MNPELKKHMKNRMKFIIDLICLRRLERDFTDIPPCISGYLLSAQRTYQNMYTFPGIETGLLSLSLP